MVIALVIVTLPNPPGSMALISPPAAVLLIAPASVLQGAVRCGVGIVAKARNPGSSGLRAQGGSGRNQ